MTEGSQVGAMPGREAEELVAEADSEDRRGPSAPRTASTCVQRLGICRARSRYDDAVEVGELVGRGRVGRRSRLRRRVRDGA